MSRQYQFYDAELRRRAATEAIALVGEGMSAMRACDQVSGEIGCHPNSVKAWAREIDPGFGRALRAHEVPGEIHRLRDEIHRLRGQIRDQSN